MTLRRYFCKHKYVLLTTHKKDIDSGVGYDLEELFVMYCPKCKKEIEVLKYQHDTIMAKQRIEEERATK